MSNRCLRDDFVDFVDFDVLDMNLATSDFCQTVRPIFRKKDIYIYIYNIYEVWIYPWTLRHL